MPQHCLKLFKNALLTGVSLTFIGWTNEDPADLLSPDSSHLPSNLYFTATANPLFKNTVVCLYILDFAYVFSSAQNSILRYLQLKRQARIKSLQIVKPSYTHPGKLVHCFLYAIIASYISLKKSLFCLWSSLNHDSFIYILIWTDVIYCPKGISGDYLSHLLRSIIIE